MSALPVRRPRARTEGQRRPRLRVVPEHKPRHTLAFLLLYVAVAAGSVFAAVSLNALAAGDAVEARQLEQAVVDQEREYGRLVAEIARLEDPGRIRQAAADLGMVSADTPRYLFIDRPLPVDGSTDDSVVAGETTDPLKPVLSAER